MRTKRTVTIILLIAVAAAAALLIFRGNIAKRVYDGRTGALESSMPDKLRVKYGEELRYTMNKFWDCYEEGIVTQNDMTDILERAEKLRAKEEMKDGDVFEFIGYVSRVYTDGMKKRHEEMRKDDPDLPLVEEVGG